MMTTRIVVGLTAGTCLIFSQNLMAEVSVFNPALLEIDHQSGVDIRQFNRANLMPPGVYSVDIFINGKMFERQDVTFVQDNPDADLHACFIAIKKTLSSFGIKVDALKSFNDVDETVCLDPAPRIEGSSWQFDSDKLQLNISIPQIYMDAMAYDYISPRVGMRGLTRSPSTTIFLVHIHYVQIMVHKRQIPVISICAMD